MENDAACKTVGIDNICMKMFDGQVRTLKDVRHVLDMRKNLLSLGALKVERCKFSVTDGALKVIKGSMTVLKAEHTTNLYKVIESVVIGDAFVTTEDTTRLWHMPLGHMGKRGVRALHKKGVLSGTNAANLSYVCFALWVDSRE